MVRLSQDSKERGGIATNLQAFQIIQTLGLHYPQSYDLREAMESSQKKFYLRYDKRDNYESRVVSRDELIAESPTLEKDIAAGKLLKIENYYNSVAGCAAYVNKDEIYGEYVSGHIIALLRRGVCNKRFFIDERDKVTVKDAFQGFEAIQENGRYLWIPCENKTDKLEEVIHFLAKNINRSQQDLLLEILITEDDIVVCDAKYPGMEAGWQGMKGIFEANWFHLKGSNRASTLEGEAKIDGFDVDAAVPAKNILVGNGAVLSHYITRNYANFDSIQFLRTGNCVYTIT